MKFLGHGSAAHHRAPFQDRDLEACGGQICRAHQAVVAAADDQCVALGICAACFAHIILLRTRKAIHSMSNWLQMLRQILVHNSLADWLAAALVFLLTFTVLPLLRGYLRARRSHYANRALPPAVALYVADRILTLPKPVDRGFEIAIIAGCWLQIGIWAGAAARFGLQRQQARSGDPRLAGSIDIVLFALRLIIWIIVALLALENLGINVGPLIAGLGVGGIAIGLAVQTILGDLFASLSIALDKPFGVGDSLRIDSFERAVEQIGIKSTRLRSVTGEQIIISN